MRLFCYVSVTLISLKHELRCNYLIGGGIGGYTALEEGVQNGLIFFISLFSFIFFLSFGVIFSADNTMLQVSRHVGKKSIAIGFCLYSNLFVQSSLQIEQVVLRLWISSAQKYRRLPRCRKIRSFEKCPELVSQYRVVEYNIAKRLHLPRTSGMKVVRKISLHSPLNEKGSASVARDKTINDRHYVLNYGVMSRHEISQRIKKKDSEILGRTMIQKWLFSSRIRNCSTFVITSQIGCKRWPWQNRNCNSWPGFHGLGTLY